MPSAGPRQISQILIVEKKGAVSPVFEANTASLRRIYPGAAYHLYERDELADFIATHFPPEIKAAFHALKPFAFQADLARYCLLYKLGGLYSDLSYFHLAPIMTNAKTELVVFRDVPGHPSWAVSNGVILARPGSPVLQNVIARVAAHHQLGFTGIHPLEVTGPYMFGRVLAETESWGNIMFGDSPVLPASNGRRPTITKTMPSGEVVAIRNKTRDGEISDMVPQGGNNYIKLWHDGAVWQGVRAKSVLQRVKGKLGI